MEKKIKSLQACVVILAIALCACVYKISALDSRIEQLDYLLDRQYDRIMTDVNEIYQNVDEKLREEASLLSSVEAEYGEFHPEDYTIDVTVKLVPKLISDDMKVQVSINGRSQELSRTGNDLTGTFERSYGIDLGVAPGIVMFLNNYSALEVNVGVLGFSYSHTKATTDRVYVSRRDNHSANLQLNLFSISFGVAFYL